MAAARGLAIDQGDCVLVRTGWGRHWPDPDAYLSARTGAPGPDATACRWLADRGVALVGADTPTVECYRPGAAGPAFPGHLLLLVERGVHLLENANLEALAAAGVAEFLFVCLPAQTGRRHRLPGATDRHRLRPEGIGARALPGRPGRAASRRVPLHDPFVQRKPGPSGASTHPSTKRSRHSSASMPVSSHRALGRAHRTFRLTSPPPWEQ